MFQFYIRKWDEEGLGWLWREQFCLEGASGEAHTRPPPPPAPPRTFLHPAPSCVEELGGQQRQGSVRPDVQQSSQKRAWWEGQPCRHHPEQRMCMTLPSPVLRNENVGPRQTARVPQCCLCSGKPMERARREVLQGSCLLYTRLGPRVSL